MSIKARLVFGVCAVVVLLAGFLVYLVSAASTTVNAIEGLEADEVRVLALASEIEQLSVAKQVSMTRIVLGVLDSGQEHADEGHEDEGHGTVDWHDRFDEQSVELEGHLSTLSEVEAGHSDDLAALLGLGQDLTVIEAELLSIADSGNGEAVQELLNGEYTEHSEEFQESVGELVSEETVALDTAFATRISDAKAARTLSVVILGGIAALIVGSGVALALSISRRLGELSSVSERLSRGDINGLSIEVDGSDEIGQLGSSMQGVLAAIEFLHEEVAANQADSVVV